MGFENAAVMQFIAGMLAISIGVFWFLCFIHGLNGGDYKRYQISDRFDIGYIDEPTYVHYKEVVRPAKRKPKKKTSHRRKQQQKLQQKQETQTQSISDEIIKESVSTLVRMGYKTSEAKAEVQRLIKQNPSVNSTEQIVSAILTKRGR